jgi:UDP-2,4-diacetamido-2,4,6-trideoxy-beta-L-altropyranose hydrolase
MEFRVKPLLIRADASAQIGTGHIMRCLALAQAWQDAGGHVTFLMAMEAPALESRLHSEGMEVVYLPVQPGSTGDAIQTADFARQVGADWVVVDGYHFGAGFQRAIKGSGLCLLFIDDNGHAMHYSADLVLNQNIHAHEGLYQNREPYTRLLLGTRYVLLRREFLKWRGWKREIPDVARKVLVTMGGSDPDNVTLKVIQALQQVDVDGLEARVVVGEGNQHYEELQAAVRDSRVPIRLESNVMTMPKLMVWADVAVSGGGSTCWELAFMGLPSLILFLADNQRLIAERVDGMGAAVNLGWYEGVSRLEIAWAVKQLVRAPKTRAETSQRSQQLVDGDGVARVLMCLNGEKLRLRQVREDDCRLLWEWANDSDVREVSFSSELIPWEEHLQWFKSKLESPNDIFYIAVNREEVPIGQIRYDMNGCDAEISVSVFKKFRGKGFGSAMIKLSSQRLFNVSNVNKIHAYVKQGNEASTHIFLRMGFRNKGVTKVHNHQASHFVLDKADIT